MAEEATNLDDEITANMAARLAPTFAEPQVDAPLPPRPRFVSVDIPESPYVRPTPVRTIPEPPASASPGKAPVWQGVLANFPNALLQISHVSAYGATKRGYFEDWKHDPDSEIRLRNSLGEHLLAVAGGQVLDEESQLTSSTHLAWYALAVLELELRKMANGG